jgi:hypothetical protein
VGLHCKCTDKEEKIVKVGKYTGPVSGDAIKSLLNTVEGLSPELASEHALGLLSAISEELDKKTGIFAPEGVKFPMLSVSEHGKFEIVDVDTPDQAKDGMKLFAGKLAESVDAVTKERDDLKGKLKIFEEREAKETAERKTHIIEVLASAHESYASEEGQKVLAEMDIKKLEALAGGLLESNHAAPDKRPNYTLNTPPVKKVSTDGIGLATPLNKEQHLKLRDELKTRIGRELFPRRGRQDLPDIKGGKK